MAEFPGLKSSRELPSPKDPSKYADPENKAFPLWPKARITVAHSYIHKYWQWKKAGKKMSGVTATYTNEKFARVHTKIVRAMIDNGITHRWLDDGLDATLPESLKKKSQGYPGAKGETRVYAGEVGEVLASELKPDIPLAPGVNLEELTKGDENPYFVYVKALRVGESRNRRIYSKKILERIIRALPLYGYAGHPTEIKEYPPFRDPKTVWIGGEIRNDWLYLKGYIPKTEEDFREWIRVSLASGAPLPISIWGEMALRPMGEGRYEVEDFNPVSVDWAPHREEGMPGARVIAVAGEEKGGENVEDKLTREARYS